MRAANFLRHSIVATAASTIALLCVHCPSAAPLPSSTVMLKTAAPVEVTRVGYLYRDADGAWINGSLVIGLVGATAVSPFYGASYYPAYVYGGPPGAYEPLPYDGPAVFYGRPLLAPDPFYPLFFSHSRG